MLSHVAEKSFVIVQAGWLASQVRQLIEQLTPSHIVVALDDEKRQYYLFNTAEAQALLQNSGAEAPALRALSLDQREATPILDADDDELNAPAQAVVMDAGYIVGFIDANVPPPPFAQKRGSNEQALASSVTRSVVTDFPDTVALGKTISLLVYLSAEVLEGAPSVVVSIGTEIDVIVQARKRFEIIGDREQQIKVTDEAETPALQFKFRATEVGLGTIRINLCYKGQALCRPLDLQAEIVASTDEASKQQTRKWDQPLSLVIEPTPDLSLIILEHRISGQPHLTFALTTNLPNSTSHNTENFGPLPLKSDSQQYFQDFFKDIDNLSIDETEQYLTRRGCDLFEELVPNTLRDRIWALRSHIRSVQLTSEEPWIPWELCKLLGTEDGRIVEGPFLCEAFAMTRWLPDLIAKPALKLKNIALVVPNDSGLSYAVTEREYLLSLSNDNRKVEIVPATRLDVGAAFEKGAYDSWHFTGHGAINPTRPELSALQLQDGDTLRPFDLSGKYETLGAAQPLVFLNACQSGQSARSLTGIGGWAQRFLRAASESYATYGAAAFIGTYWSISDETAHKFSRAFYDSLLKGTTIGEAVQAARLAIRSKDDPTWLAYTVFAHPMAKVV